MSKLNKKCLKCTEECKQAEYIKILRCPYFRNKEVINKEKDNGGMDRV